MKTANIRLIVIAALALLAAVVAGVMIGLPILKTRTMEATQAAMLNAPHICLPGTSEKVERWGPAGYARYCEKDGLKHGSYVAWEGGRKVIEGQFAEGKQHGLWTHLDESGRATRVIEYSDGKIINDTGPGPRSSTDNR